MRKTKLICVLLATLLLAGCSGTAAPAAPAATEAAAAPAVGIEATVHQEADHSSLMKAVPGVLMADAPLAATSVSYSWIEGTPVISQITFDLDGCSYTYRGAAAADRNNLPDISGVTDTLDASVSQTAPDSGTLAGGDFTLYYSSQGSAGKAVWYYAPTDCQYCVYSPTGANVAQGILTVVKQVMPISEVHLADLQPSGSVTGATVVSYANHEVVVNTTDGKTLMFDTELLTDLSIKTGDVVDISYNDYFASYMIALSVTKDEAAPAPETPESYIHGTVYSFTDDGVYVSTDSNIVYGFDYDANTKFSGQSTVLKAGNTVTVYYDGAPIYAKEIQTTAVSAAPAPTAAPTYGGTSDPSQTNKQLTGTVTDYDYYNVTVYTVNGNYWTFRIGSLTNIYGEYILETGCQVRVTYDGYASSNPVAKSIQVQYPGYSYSDDGGPGVGAGANDGTGNTDDGGPGASAGGDPYAIPAYNTPPYSDPYTSSQSPVPSTITTSGTLVSMSTTGLVMTETSTGSQLGFVIDGSTVITGISAVGVPVTVTYYASQMEGDQQAVSVYFRN